LDSDSDKNDIKFKLILITLIINAMLLADYGVYAQDSIPKKWHYLANITGDI